MLSPLATHVVCPLCGKSSTLRSFPSRGKPDLALRSFRGRGRGKGFDVTREGSGLEEPALATAVESRLLDVLCELVFRGHEWQDDDANASMPREFPDATVSAAKVEPTSKDGKLDGEDQCELEAGRRLVTAIEMFERELDHERDAASRPLGEAGLEPEEPRSSGRT